MAVAAPPTLLERADQLSELTGRLAAVRESGRGGVVLVRGEAGIGKTALVREFVDGLDRSVRGLWAACDPLFTPRPLGPLLDIAAATAGELASRVQAGAQPHDVAVALLTELHGRRPTVLVLEDVHWADEATLDVMRLIARRIESVPALLIATYRSDQLARTHPLQIVLGELPPGRRIQRMELIGLSRAAVSALAASSSLDADELYDRTTGNPFFVTEALAAETERVPETIRDAVLARAARLSPSGRSLLDAIAVVPQRAELWLAQALAPDALGALDECLSSGMLTAGSDGVGFRHELARLAIEASVSPERLVDLHRRAVRALQAPPAGAADLARLAHHADGAGDAELVLRFAPAAAEQAAALGAPRESLEQYGRALRYAPAHDPEGRAHLLEAFADAGYLTDMRQEAVAALDEALIIHRGRGDRLREGRVLRLRSRLLTCMGRTVQSMADAHAAIGVLEQLPDSVELARAYSALSHICMLCDRHEETLESGRRAIDLADRLDDPEALVNALNNVGVILLEAGDSDGLPALERSLSISLARGFGPDAGRAYINISLTLARLHRSKEARRFIAAGIDYCREQGLEAWLNCLLANRADLELATGQWDAAADTAWSLISAPPNAVVSPRYDALLVLARLRARRGDPGYWPLLEEATAIAQAVGDLQFVAAIALARAEVAWLEGRPEAIEAETEQALALAKSLGDQLFSAELNRWRARGAVAQDGPPLGGDWRAVARTWDERGCVYEAALARHDSGDREALREALDILSALRAPVAQAIVARRLRALGERGLRRGPRATTQANPAGLTAREVEVLVLVARGLRNADIARRLVVSPKTVDHHVSAILRKLDARTRAEAAVRATQLGLTRPI